MRRGDGVSMTRLFAQPNVWETALRADAWLVAQPRQSIRDTYAGDMDRIRVIYDLLDRGRGDAWFVDGADGVFSLGIATPLAMKWVLWVVGLDAVREDDHETLERLLPSREFRDQFDADDKRDVRNHFADVSMSNVKACCAVANVLLTHGADPQCLSLLGSVSTNVGLHFLSHHGAPEIAIPTLFHFIAWSHLDEKALRTLITLGVDPHASDAESWHRMTSFGKWHAIKLVVDEWRVDVDTADVNNHTPLMSAVGRCDVQLLGLLLAKNADATLQDAFGRTALANAAMSGTFDIVERLLQHGADPNQRDDDERTALDHALEGDPDVVDILHPYGGDKGRLCSAKRRRR